LFERSALARKDSMSRFSGSSVLITGAAQGMGRLFAQKAVERGAVRLVLWDVHQTMLEAAVAEIRTHFPSVQIQAKVVDVSNTESVLMAAQEAGAVDILFNNAGIIVGKLFLDHTSEEIDREMAINTLALMHLTHALLPGMIARRHGHIINMASTAGLVANPRMSVYCASKWAVIGWSESLLLELRAGHTGVRVTTVMPYYIKTGMFTGVRSSALLPLMEPEVAACAIFRAVERNSPRLRMPWQMYSLPFIKGILPAPIFDLVIGKMLGVYSGMEKFTGR
jgi:all-trans-retinol dehydrogenase (NAD+)